MKPLWHLLLRECDVCVVATSVKVGKAPESVLLSNEKARLAEFIPVSLEVKDIPFCSQRAACDGIFRLHANKIVLAEAKGGIMDCYYQRKWRNTATGETTLIRDGIDEKLSRIFFIVRSTLPPNGSYIITSSLPVDYLGEVSTEIDRLPSTGKRFLGIDDRVETKMNTRDAAK